MTAVCSGTKRDGSPCTASVPPGRRWCYYHDPALAEERSASASRAVTAKHSSVAKELREEVRALILELLDILLADELPVRVRKELQNVVQLLQCYLRAAELGMRAADEPLRSDLDVKRLKARVLGRIEEREHEREETLLELVPTMEARGYDTAAEKAVLGG